MLTYGGRVPKTRTPWSASRSPRYLLSASAALVLASMGLAACSSSPDVAPVASTSAATPSSSSATPTPTPTSASPSPSPSSTYGIPAGASPFSGLPGGANKPVLSVKIDNTSAAQPHAGLTAADVVYVEEVEWGLTRLNAIFATTMPKVIGPVRSARISDIDILAQYGKIAFANSGAQSKLLAILAKANLFDVSASTDGPGYSRDPARHAPVDEMLDPKTVLNRVPDDGKAKDIGFVFSETPPAGGQPVREVTAKWDDADISFTWDDKTKSWVVGFNGEESKASEGGAQHAATVVIQQVTQTDSGYGDMYGGKTPMVESVGSGTAIVLRDGKLWSVKWNRPNPESGTHFTLADGRPMPFAIGQEWIVYLDKSRTPVIK